MSKRIQKIILFVLSLFLLHSAFLDFYTEHEKYRNAFEFPDDLHLNGKNKDGKSNNDESQEIPVTNVEYKILTSPTFLLTSNRSNQKFIKENTRAGPTQIHFRNIPNAIGNIVGNLNSRRSINFFNKLIKEIKTILISNFPSEFPPRKKTTLSMLMSTLKFKEDMGLIEKNRDGIWKDLESKVIHRKYWQINGKNSEDQRNNSVSLVSDKNERNFKKAEEFVMKRIFGGKRDSTFWSMRPNKGRRQTHAFGPEYDHRFLNQLLWLKEANKLRPDVFNKANPKKKSIAVLDGMDWWNYKGNKSLSCPGSPFGGTCEIINGYAENVDTVITIRDWRHTPEYLLPRNVANIYYILESPFATPRVDLLRPNDILASYWRGSDIPTPYAKWAYYDPDITHKKQDRNYADGKTKMVAVFMSNCVSMNARINYIEELKKHIKVDFYGACGNLNCERSEGKKCLEMLKKHYRFYLAFENSNCRDYITEKFFDTALQNDVIPVVLGAHPDDYKAAAPRGSYIHVEDFDSPKSLAQYLKYVANSDILFNKYFQWKGTGEFISANFFCRVCSMLHYSDIFPPPKRKAATQWKAFIDPPDPMCLSPGHWYWKR